MNDKDIQMMLILTLSVIVILGLIIILISMIRNRKIDVLTSDVIHNKEDIADKMKITINTTMNNNGKDDSGSTIKLFKTNYDKCNSTAMAKKQEIRLYDKERPKIMLQKVIEKNVILGRSEKDCDILVNYDGRVSGKHCELTSVKGQVFVKDLKSSNGTRVNNKGITTATRIGTGDTLYVGGVEFLVEIVEV